jgi:hypothetical protein
MAREKKIFTPFEHKIEKDGKIGIAIYLVTNLLKFLLKFGSPCVHTKKMNEKQGTYQSW